MLEKYIANDAESIQPRAACDTSEHLKEAEDTLTHFQDSGRNAHTVFLAIQHSGDGVQIVFKWTTRSIFGVRYLVTDMSYLRIFKSE